MYIFLFLLTFVLLLVIFIGLIKPGIVIKWGIKEKRTRGKVLKIYGLLTIVCFVLFVITIPEMTPEEEVAYAAEQKANDEKVAAAYASDQKAEKEKDEAKAIKEAKAEEKAKEDAKVEEMAKEAAKEEEKAKAEEKAIEDAKEEKVKEEEKQMKIASLLTSTKSSISKFEYKKAIEQSNEVLKLDKNNLEAKELIKEAGAGAKKKKKDDKIKKVQAYKDSCKSIDYRKISKSPDDYEGERVTYSGIITYAKEEKGYTTLIITTNEDMISDDILVGYDGKLDIFKGDEIVVYGTLDGESEMKTDGVESNVPLIRAKYIESSTEEVKQQDTSDPEEKAYKLAKELLGGEVSSMGQFSQDGINYYQFVTVNYPKVQIIIDNDGNEYDAYEYNSTGVLISL